MAAPLFSSRPAVPPSLHHWAGRGELPLISRPVAGKAWHFMGLLLPLHQAVVWAATWTNLLGHTGFKTSRLTEEHSLPSHWGILSRHAEERILGLRSERAQRGWRGPDHHTTGQLAFQGQERTTHSALWFTASICNSTPWIKGVHLETDQLTSEMCPELKK